MSLNIAEVQKDLRAAKLDGWLFYDFRGRDPIAQRILALPPGMRTRRWFYFVPAKGEPRKLVHKIESASLAALPGETLYFSAQQELAGNLKKLLGRGKTVAMQYSPKNAIPYVSMVDAGTIELVRSAGRWQPRRTWCRSTRRAGARRNSNRTWRRDAPSIRLYGVRSRRLPRASRRVHR